MYNVVIADDEYLEREVIKRIVSDIDGAQIVGEGNSGRLAVELCSALKPDLIFLNCHMGGMDGFEAARRIRKNDADVKIVMTTAFDALMTRRDLEAHNIADYLLKPVRPETIRDIVQKDAGRSGRKRQNAPKQKRRGLRYYPNQIMSKEITRALIYMNAHYLEGVSLDAVAAMVSLSSYYFSRLFKKEVGVNFSDFLLHKKLDSAKRLLEETDKSILEISSHVGFQEQSYFCKVFKKHVGTTPSAYRKNADGVRRERKSVKDKYLL